MEEPRIELGALYMRSTRDTTTPHSRFLKGTTMYVSIKLRLDMKTELSKIKWKIVKMTVNLFLMIVELNII